MTEEQIKLQKALEYFDQFVNAALRESIQGVSPLETVKNYNVIRDELAKLLAFK
jgi:hypothetical protein